MIIISLISWLNTIIYIMQQGISFTYKVENTIIYIKLQDILPVLKECLN